MNFCSQCQSVQVDTAKFCNDCGKPLAGGLASETQLVEPVKQIPVADTLKAVGQLISSVVSLVFIVGLVWLFWPAGNASPSPAAASYQATDTAQALRDDYAHRVRDTVRESGCPKCGARADGTVLVLTNPDTAPRAMATQLLADKTARAGLKGLGFTMLKVKQDTGVFAQGFDYPID